MPKLFVVYDSRTGNTERMAKAVAEGAKAVKGAEVILAYRVKAEELAEADAIILGSPTHHHEITKNMKGLLEELASSEVKLKGKVGAAFGSYGWSGEAPDLLLEVMKNRFEMEVVKPGLRIKYTPNEKGLEECRRLGKTIAERIMKSA